jgi:hypothetical protein
VQNDSFLKLKVLEETKSLTFLTLFSNEVSAAMFSCGELRTLVSMVSAVKQ